MRQKLLTPPVKIALVGCGQIGRLHAERLSRDDRAKLVAFCDPVRETAVEFLDRYQSGAAVYTDFGELPDDESLDAVVLCTPTLLHYEQVSTCWKRGWHVLCEKPLAESRAHIKDLIAAADAGGPLLSIAYQRRHWAIYETLRRELQSGAWGPLRTITLDMAERWQPTIGGRWRDDPRHNPGGFLSDAGSHKVDLLFYLTGLVPEEVFAVSENHGSRVDIVTSIVGRLSGGVTLSMNFIGNSEHWHEELHVYCERADFIVRDSRLWRAEANELHEIAITDTCSDPDRRFLDCLTQGVENPAPAECALPVSDFTDAVLRSAKTGQVVRCGH